MDYEKEIIRLLSWMEVMERANRERERGLRKLPPILPPTNLIS
jgi:hypothetical protein